MKCQHNIGVFYSNVHKTARILKTALGDIDQGKLDENSARTEQPSWIDNIFSTRNHSLQVQYKFICSTRTRYRALKMKYLCNSINHYNLKFKKTLLFLSIIFHFRYRIFIIYMKMRQLRKFELKISEKNLNIMHISIIIFKMNCHEY